MTPYKNMCTKMSATLGMIIVIICCIVFLLFLNIRLHQEWLRSRATEECSWKTMYTMLTSSISTKEATVASGFVTQTVRYVYLFVYALIRKISVLKLQAYIMFSLENIYEQLSFKTNNLKYFYKYIKVIKTILISNINKIPFDVLALQCPTVCYVYLFLYPIILKISPPSHFLCRTYCIPLRIYMKSCRLKLTI